MSTPLTVVLGGTGGIGGALVAELASRGERVRSVSRSAPGKASPDVEHVVADVNTAQGAAAAVAGAAVVHHAAQPPYTEWDRFPHLTSTIAEAAANEGAKLVLADNLYCYGPHDEPMTEDTAMAAGDHKGRIRAKMSQDLLELHRTGRLRVSLGRLSDYFGPGGVASSLGETLFGRALAGKKPQWVGRLDQPHTIAYLPDAARGLIVLGERDGADGRAWHIPAGPPVTGRQLLDLLATELGRPVKAQVASKGMLKVLGVLRPMMKEIAEVSYQWERPWVADSTAFQAAFAPFPVTEHGAAVADTVAWYRGRG